MRPGQFINNDAIILAVGLLLGLIAGYYYINGRLLWLYFIVVPIFVSSFILKNRLKYLFYFILVFTPLYSAAMLDPYNGAGYPLPVLMMPVLLAAVVYQGLKIKNIILGPIDYCFLTMVLIYIISTIANNRTIEKDQLVAGTVIILTAIVFYLYAMINTNNNISKPELICHKLSLILWSMATAVVVYLVIHQLSLGFHFKLNTKGGTLNGSVGAGILSVVILYSYSYYLSLGDNKNKVIALIFLCVSTTGLIITWSRTWYLSTLIGLLFIMWLYGKKSLIRQVIIVLVLISCFMAFTSYQNMFFSEGDFETTTRYGIWNSGLVIVMKHPLFGVGIGNFPKYSLYYYWGGDQKATSLHSAYLQQAVDNGLPAALCLIVLLAAAFYTGHKLFKNKNPLIRAYGGFLMTVVISHAIAGLTAEEIIPSFVNRKYLGLTSSIYFWSVLGIGQGLLTANKNESSFKQDE